MSEELQMLASATTEITAAAALVRAQFFDLDQHVREHIYHGHELSRAAGDRLRIVTRVLGRVQEEEFLIEEGPGATWVRRYVEGPNRDAQFVAQFTQTSAETTRVRLEARVPARGW